MSDFAARLRNLFSRGTFDSRDSDDPSLIKINTRFGRAVKGREFFPYGFSAKGKDGAVLVLFEGGDVRSPVMLPLGDVDGAPSLDEGDAALWTKNGGWIVVRDAGDVELNGKKYNGLVKVDELKSQLGKLTAFVSAVKQVLQVPIPEPGNGSPSTFQAALKTAVATVQDADFGQIENGKVKHGDGSNR